MNLKIFSSFFEVAIAGVMRGNPQADTSPLEREIDQLVYQLYGLTEEDVRIVDGKG